MLEEDFAALKSVKPDDKKTLGSIFTMSRTDEVEMTIADKDIRTIGANSSVRVPLEIQTETGTAKGIFTEESKVQTLKEIADGLQKQYGNAVASEFLDCFKVDKKDPSEAEFDDGGYNMAKFDELDTALKECFRQMKHMTITDADMINEKDTFMFIFHSALKNNMGSERARKYLGKISESEESRKEFLDFAHDLSSDLHDYFVANTGGMEAGSSVPDRNVGMCRVAESLGIGHLVAGAKKIRLKDSDGFVRQGVFQETVEYSDYARLKNNDPLYEIGRNPQLMDDPNILMQIADLQILDYVCGNNDRHQSNILYDMQIVDGKPKLVAIKGIDNDRSLGLLTKKDIEEFGHITPPDMMKVIRLSTATALAELSEDKLRLMLHDLSISDAEVKAAMKRVEDIKDAINKGKIKILDDEDFKKYKMDDLTESKMVGEEKKSNTFAIIGAIRNNIKKRKPVPEQDLPYNAAKAVTEKQYRRADTGPLYLQAVKAHAAELESTLAKFVEKNTSTSTAPLMTGWKRP